MLRIQILTSERSAKSGLLRGFIFLIRVVLAADDGAYPELEAQVLGGNMALPLILVGKGLRAAGKVEDADEWPPVLSFDVLLERCIILESHIRTMRAGMLDRGRS